MKRTNLFLLMSLFCALGVKAQDTALAKYTGHYHFDDDAPAKEVQIAVNEGKLTASASVGSAILERKEKDIFTLIGYAGTVEFIRNKDQKISGIVIKIDGLESPFEGEKTEDNSNAVAINHEMAR